MRDIRKILFVLCLLFFGAHVHIVSASASEEMTWVQKSPSSSPSARSYHSMTYDEARKQVVLFGGNDWSPGSNVDNDTWVWDGINWTQKQPSSSPSKRMGAMMAYDAAREQVVLFGGAKLSDDYILNNETWVWDGTNWTQKQPSSSPSPSGLDDASMAYDAINQQVVLYLGEKHSDNTGKTSEIAKETWIWDGTNWTQKHPSSSPSAYAAYNMTYDALHQQIVLFGGDDDGQGQINETWVWDGTNWTQKHPSSSPSKRILSKMVYDSVSKQVVLFGGQSNGNFLNDTWVWDGFNWIQKHPFSFPSARSSHQMAYDVARQQVVLFSGYDNTFNDTWVYGKSSSTPILTATLNPASPNGTNGWYTSDVTVTLATSDNLPGVAKKEYRINGGTWTTYNGAFNVTTEGTNTLEYRSTDNAGNVAQTKSMSINIDKTPPVLNISLDKTMLSPANHKFVIVNATVYGTDSISGIESIVLTSITSNEPDIGLGNGDQPNDIQIVNDKSFYLRAERSGSGNGRVYTIVYTGMDKAGNKFSTSTTVTVPHDASKK